MSACVATNMLHLQHSISLNLLLTALPIYQNIIIMIMALIFNSNISVTSIYTLHLTGFDYGILLNVSERMFHRFYRTVVLIMMEIIVSLINMTV